MITHPLKSGTKVYAIIRNRFVERLPVGKERKDKPGYYSVMSIGPFKRGWGQREEVPFADVFLTEEEAKAELQRRESAAAKAEAHFSA